MPRQKRDFPWVDQEPNGVYYVHWYDEQSQRTKRRSLGTRDQMEAQGRFAQFLTHGLQDVQFNRPAQLTVRQAVEDYIAEHVNRHCKRPKVLAVAARWPAAFFGDTPLKDIGVPECQRYADARRSGLVKRDDIRGDKRPGDGTIRLELAYLAAAAEHAATWKRISRADLPEIRKPKKPDSRKTFLYPDELDALRAAATGRAATFIELAYYTASRRAAIEQLTWFQVDLAKNRINLSKPGDQQTSKRRPIVPIDENLRPLLQRLRDEATTEYVLGHPGQAYDAFKDAAAAAGLLWLPDRELRPAARLHPHALRHSRATHLLWDGVGLDKVAQLLGDSVQTTEANYIHHCPGVLEKALGERKDLGR